MFARTMMLAAALFGGVLTSQLPEFAQQYRQRLGGAVDELGREVAGFDRDASAAGLERQQAVTLMKQAPEKLVQLRGASAEATIERYDRLRAQLAAFEASGPVGRVESLLSAPDRDLVGATFSSYKPAVPTTAAGAVAAAIGFLLVYLGCGAGALAVRPLRRRSRRPARPQPIE